MKFKSRNLTTTKNHWLDYAEEKYGPEMVFETRSLLNVLVLYPPLILFWALFDQQGSRWVFQATRMDGSVGSFTIKPDQFNVINPLLVLILIPTCEYVLYPLIAKVGIKTSLQKATLGGVLAGVSFVISTVVELQLERHHMHMTWLVPQYVVMTLGEVLISVPLIDFSYNEAPRSMKSILQAFRYLTIGVGNLIVAIVAGTKLINSQSNEFLLFAGLMFIDMVIFGFLARRYKPFVKTSAKSFHVSEQGSVKSV